MHKLAGDFVRSNELQEGDFIVIYSDVKSGKYVMFITSPSYLLSVTFTCIAYSLHATVFYGWSVSSIALYIVDSFDLVELSLQHLVNSKISVYLQLIRGVKVRPTPQDQAKQKHGSQEKGGSSDLKAGPEEGGAAAADAGGCKGESPHGASRSRQEAASMNQMAVST